MIVETEEKDVRHPQGKILLKNGNVLDCYEKGDRPVTIKPSVLQFHSKSTKSLLKVLVQSTSIQIVVQ